MRRRNSRENNSIKRLGVFMFSFSMCIFVYCGTSNRVQNSIPPQAQNLLCEEDVLYIPNTFSPNNDGTNDTWKPIYKDSIESLHGKVFSKYGEMVYQSEDKTFSWDGIDVKGRPCEAGTYLYIIDYRYKGNLQRCKGALVLIR